MEKEDKQARFLCHVCKRYFDLRLQHCRNKRNYCPTCYVDKYDTWECDEEMDSVDSGRG